MGPESSPSLIFVVAWSSRKMPESPSRTTNYVSHSVNFVPQRYLLVLLQSKQTRLCPNDKPIIDHGKGGQAILANLILGDLLKRRPRLDHGREAIAIVEEEMPRGVDGRSRIPASTIDPFLPKLLPGFCIQAADDSFVIVHIDMVAHDDRCTFFGNAFPDLPSHVRLRHVALTCGFDGIHTRGIEARTNIDQAMGIERPRYHGITFSIKAAPDLFAIARIVSDHGTGCWTDNLPTAVHLNGQRCTERESP